MPAQVQRRYPDFEGGDPQRGIHCTGAHCDRYASEEGWSQALHDLGRGAHRTGFCHQAHYSCPRTSPFCYTSGTRSAKGALITHQNIIAVANAAMSSVFADIEHGCVPRPPALPHIFERMVLTAMLSSGGPWLLQTPPEDCDTRWH